MDLFDIAIHSLKRQKSRKLFLVGAMMLSICAAIILFTFVKSQARELESQFDQYGANIVVTPKTDSLSLSYGVINLSGIVTNIDEIPAELVSHIYDIPNTKNLRAVSPKLIGVGAARTSSSTGDVLLVGIDFAEEQKIKAWWEIDGRFPELPNEAILGVTAADRLGLGVGDELFIKDEPLIVAGILRSTGSQDDSAVLVSMGVAETILGKHGSVSLIEISALCSDCPIDDLVAQISEIIPTADVRAIRQIMQQRMQVTRQFERFAVSVFIVLTVMCGLFIFAATAGSVSERKKEIGILKAVGFSHGNIARIVLTEIFLLAVSAAIAGVAGSLLFLRFALPALTEIEHVVYDPLLIALCITGLLILSLVSAIAPAARASRIDPVTAITSL